MKNHSGFVLLTALFIISVLMLMTVSQWQTFLIYQRMCSLTWRETKTLHYLEEAATWCWQHYHALKTQGIIQWRHQEFAYRFIDEGIYPCVQVKIANQLYSTHHVTIIIWSIKNTTHKMRIRFSRAHQLEQCAATNARVIRQNIISWQYGFF